MENKRPRFSAEEKVRLLRLYLVEKRSISDICNETGINPNTFYNWQQQFFENASAAFEKASKGHRDNHVNKLEQQSVRLKEKLTQKDEVIAEIMASHVELKKSLGED